MQLGVCHVYLVPGDSAVYRVCVLKVICLFHLVDFVLHSKPLLHKGLVTDHNLQILHHVTGFIYVYVLIVISGGKNSTPVNEQNKCFSIYVYYFYGHD